MKGLKLKINVIKREKRNLKHGRVWWKLKILLIIKKKNEKQERNDNDFSYTEKGIKRHYTSEDTNTPESLVRRKGPSVNGSQR